MPEHADSATDPAPEPGAPAAEPTATTVPAPDTAPAPDEPAPNAEPVPDEPDSATGPVPDAAASRGTEPDPDAAPDAGPMPEVAPVTEAAPVPEAGPVPGTEAGPDAGTAPGTGAGHGVEPAQEADAGQGTETTPERGATPEPRAGAGTGTAPGAEGVGTGEDAGTDAEAAGDGAGAAFDGGDATGGEAAGEGADDEGMDALSAAMDADDGVEPRRHWLRYPGVIGALAVVAVLIMVPCGAGALFLTGAFADHGRYSAVPDACTVLDPATARGHFGQDLIRGETVGTGDDSTCDYQGGAATASDTRVHLTVTRYGTKGPLSAPRMAHAGYHDDIVGAGRPTRLPGVADEAVTVRSATGVTVYARSSNLVLRLSVTGDQPDLRPRTVAAARHIAAGLR